MDRVMFSKRKNIKYSYGVGRTEFVCLEINISQDSDFFNRALTYAQRITPNLNKGAANTCLAALDSSRMGGYGPIDYDLARYVLCDRFDAFFRQRYPKYKYTKEAEDFIRKYENKYSIKIEKIDGLIIGIAYQYLLDCGWNKEIFFSNKEREYSGVDSSILYTYPSATHGSRSSVSSVAEKYTWCARHKMFAVLSNYIPYSDYGYECQYLHDYAGIESFENAYQSYINAIKEVTVAKWYHTDRLAYLDG